ncbi:ThiF family adenylyltransferase [Niabella sp. W65]|nr:ThiF family adenylyltransferase [Niabella sp. W65]MCH7366903.1 ThiF family adenylyltransferase [Niabella sp. W65]
MTVREANILSKCLQTDEDKNTAFLKPKGILPTNILHINPSDNGTVLWHTKAKKQQLYFVDDLGIPNGTAQVPAMLWLASKSSLSVFALANNRRPTEKTPLHYAPFFNIYEKGNVCMGTVSIDIKNSASVEEFIQAWEHYFFNSYFSHSLCSNLTKRNIVSLWKDLVNTDKPFPTEALKRIIKPLKIYSDEQRKKKVHFTDNYLLNPTNPITVNLIGAGGTGSKVLTALLETNESLTALEHAGLSVRLWDDDIITTANLGRQRFFESETGLYKSVALINRVNRCIGTNWKAESRKFERDNFGMIPEEAQATITITCVDNVQARFGVAEILNVLGNRKITEIPQNIGWTLGTTGTQVKSYYLLSERLNNPIRKNTKRWQVCHLLPKNLENC